MYINGSVGKDGQNARNDVRFVQELLTLIAQEDMRIPRLTVDGLSGPQTHQTIHRFQEFYVKLRNPDSRIDPGGRSERTLIAKIIEIDEAHLKTLAGQYGLRKTADGVEQKGPKQIIYRSNAAKVLSPYTVGVLKLAMTFAGISRCDISSTIRTFADQARIMHDNCSRFPEAKSISALRAARGWGYAAPGAKVEQIYYDNLDANRESTISLMKSEIERLYGEGKKVSKHCVSEVDFDRTNILDIPYSSVISSNRRQFETTLMGISKHVQNARYPSPAKGDPYIGKLIVEDECWHLEVPQDQKVALPNENKNNEVKVCTADPDYLGRRQVKTIRRSPSSFMDYLDWI